MRRASEETNKTQCKGGETNGNLSWNHDPFLGYNAGRGLRVLFLLLLDRLIPHLHVGSEQAEGPKSKLGRTTMMVLAVALG